MSNVLIGLRSGGVCIWDGTTLDCTQLQLTDVAYGLAEINRFTGQAGRTYNDAEHSIRLYELTNELAALFHDAEETLGLGDTHYQLKNKGQKALGRKFSTAVYSHFNVPELSEKGHELDKLLGTHECLSFHPARQHYQDAGYELPDLKVTYAFYDANTAAQKWMQTYNRHLDIEKWNKSGQLLKELDYLPAGQRFTTQGLTRTQPSYITGDMVRTALPALGLVEVAPNVWEK